MAYFQIESLAFEAIMIGAQSPESAAAYVLTSHPEVAYRDAELAATNAFRKIHSDHE